MGWAHGHLYKIIPSHSRACSNCHSSQQVCWELALPLGLDNAVNLWWKLTSSFLAWFCISLIINKLRPFWYAYWPVEFCLVFILWNDCLNPLLIIALLGFFTIDLWRFIELINIYSMATVCQVLSSVLYIMRKIGWNSWPHLGVYRNCQGDTHTQNKYVCACTP